VRLMGDATERTRLGEAARAIVEENRGALECVLKIVSAKLAAVPVPSGRPPARP
jgi:hypothetical protein